MTMWIETEPDGGEVLVEQRARSRAARLYDWVVVAAWIGSGLFVLAHSVWLVVVPALRGQPNDAMSAAIMTLLFVLPGTALVAVGARARLAGFPRTMVTREAIDDHLLDMAGERPDDDEVKRLMAGRGLL